MAGGVEKVFTVWWPRGAFAALSDPSPDARDFRFCGFAIGLVWMGTHRCMVAWCKETTSSSKLPSMSAPC
eukprot:214767-Rhodomonas_salina.1